MKDVGGLVITSMCVTYYLGLSIQHTLNTLDFTMSKDVYPNQNYNTGRNEVTGTSCLPVRLCYKYKEAFSSGGILKLSPVHLVT